MRAPLCPLGSNCLHFQGFSRKIDQNVRLALADFFGGEGARKNPLECIFMQFSGKLGEIVGRRHPSRVRRPFWEILDPPLVGRPPPPFGLAPSPHLVNLGSATD